MTVMKKEEYLNSKRVKDLKELATKNNVKFTGTISKAELVAKLKGFTKVQLEIPADAESKKSKTATASKPKTKKPKSETSETKDDSSSKRGRPKKTSSTAIPREELEAAFLDFMSRNDKLNEVYNGMTDLYYKHNEGTLTKDQRSQLASLLAEAEQIQRGMPAHKAHSYVEKIKVTLTE